MSLFFSKWLVWIGILQHKLDQQVAGGKRLVEGAGLDGRLGRLHFVGCRRDPQNAAGVGGESQGPLRLLLLYTR